MSTPSDRRLAVLPAHAPAPPETKTPFLDRRLLLCFLVAGVFLAPLTLHASVGEPKRRDPLPLAPIVAQPPDAGEIAHCDARPWLNDAPTCLRPATRTEPPRLVRVVTVERRVGSSTPIPERTAFEQAIAR